MSPIRFRNQSFNQAQLSRSNGHIKKTGHLDVINLHLQYKMYIIKHKVVNKIQNLLTNVNS